MKAKDIMTKRVIRVNPDAPLSKVIRLLLKSRISGVPVVDEKEKVVGVVTEEDLLYKGKIPISVNSSVAWFYYYGDYVDPQKLADECRKVYGKTASEIMSTTPVLVSEDIDVTKIAYLMLEKGVRRVFVMKNGKLAGVVSRADLLKQVGGKAVSGPQKKSKIELGPKPGGPIKARDIMTSKVIAINRDTSLKDIATMLISNRITGVPVVDEQSRVIGIVAESDLLYDKEAVFSHSAYCDHWKDCVERFWRSADVRAEEVMSERVIAVGEDAHVEEIATLMIERKIKRVPVLREGKLIGIVSRADLLRALLMEPERLAKAHVC